MTTDDFVIEIDDELAIRIWDKTHEQEAPFLLQPFNPATGEKWVSLNEADTWAKEFVIARVDAINNPKPFVEEPVLEEELPNP